MKHSTYLSNLSFLIIYFSIPSLLFSQEQRLEFNIGFGPTLDAFHAGINFKIVRAVDVGLSIGVIPDKFDFNEHVNIGFEGKYNFGESKTIKRRVEMDGRLRNVRVKTWYGGLRMNLVTNTRTKDTEKKLIYLTPAIGRHFNFNKSFGLNVDLGLSFTVKQNTFYEGNNICRPCFLEEHPQYPLLPTLRLQFFVKI